MKNEVGHKSLEIILEITETTLDQLIDEDFIKDIPILGIAYKVARLGLSISDKIFMSKLLRFIKSTESISEEEKTSFLTKLHNQPKMQQKVGETLMLLINKLDDFDKSELLGKVFIAYVRSSITYDQFRRLCSAIDLCIVDDIKKFCKMPESSEQELLKYLVSSGLAATSSSGHTSTGDFVSVGIKKTELGTLFQNIMRE